MVSFGIRLSAHAHDTLTPEKRRGAVLQRRRSDRKNEWLGAEGLRFNSGIGCGVSSSQAKKPYTQKKNPETRLSTKTLN